MGEDSLREVAPDIYRFGSNRISWYVFVTEGAVTVVDTGAPAHWSQLVEGLAALDRSVSDVDAVVLTHSHVDHIGFAERLRSEAESTVFVHEDDVERAQTKARPPWPLLKRLYRPAVASLLIEGLRAGLANPPPVKVVDTFADGETLPIAWELDVIHLPGHTAGSSAFWLSERRVLFCGDALVTRNLLTGKSCAPRCMPAPFSVDHAKAQRSVGRLSALGRVTLLPGHGEPWRGDLKAVIPRA